jgi:hypothetical protein
MATMKKGTTFFVSTGDTGAPSTGAQAGICGIYWYVHHNFIFHMFPCKMI